jgi:hypothetical protein
MTNEFHVIEETADVEYRGKFFSIPYKAVISNGYVSDVKFEPEPELFIAAFTEVSDLLARHAIELAKQKGWIKE